MPTTINYTNEEKDIKYKNLIRPQISTGFPFSVEPYEIENGQLTKYPLPLINATDINWGGVEIGETEINKTDDLIALLKSGNIGGNSGQPIDSNTIIPMMLSAIRALQSEVMKLRNSFVDGIYSCTGKETKMSVTNYSYNEIDAQEPLWAIDESTLSEVLVVDLTTANNFDHNENIQIDVENNSLTFNELSTWNDSNNVIESIINSEVIPSTSSKNFQAMPKIYVYLSSTGLDITFYLHNINNENDIIPIHLSELVNSNESNLYNILFVLATSIKETKNNIDIYYGKNFSWVQVGHFIYDGIQQGYYNKIDNKLQDDEITFGENRYVLKSISFNNLTLSKLNFYTKYQNFSKEVESINPNYDTRYKTAHITIRSIDTYSDLVEIKDQLPENELIYVEQTNTLYIKNEYKLKKIGSGGETPVIPDDPEIETMTNKELIETLKKMGIVYEHYSENATSQDYDLELAALNTVTFIHEDSGRKFDISIDAYGKLQSVEQGKIQTLKERIGENVLNNIMGKKSVRGFVSNVRAKEKNKNAGNSSDMKLLSDRVKIGAFYAPLDSEEVFGCSHAYIELENTSERDFPLENCYLHFCKWNSESNSYNVYHLELDGYIPAGGTYLIRGKKYVTSEMDANVFIHVDSYDKEWYVNNDNGELELMDFTMNDERKAQTKHSWSFALTYGNENILEDTSLFEPANDSNLPEGETAVDGYTDQKVYVPGFIDSISINARDTCKWAGAAFTQTKNCIYKNTFELDPAKQAFNALHPKDSSRTRWKNAATDFQYVLLDKDIIEFPHTNEVKSVKDYTPKASFENKNVCTDKTQFDLEKPNMPTVSFGIDAFKTRCFNWLSGGQFDEYVFIKKEDGTWLHFESYKQRSNDNLYDEYVTNTSYPKRKEFHYDICNIAYCQYDGSIKESKRITSKFPAIGIIYTSHKCIIDILSDEELSQLTSPKQYTYVVGRADKNGNPDFNHCSKELHFTMYPTSYKPRVYQTTDQQGFHWVEYQVWGGVANKLNEVINNDCNNEHIIPVLINTGDMTQSGARINEWMDYYNAGECLFDHLEQMNIVGNNDLCGTDITALGTGDDPGKSNGWFYYISYCYEIPNAKELDIENNVVNIAPIVNDVIIPSLYYFDFNCENQLYRMVMMNSEITLVNCKDWFGLGYGDNDTANIYTGFNVKNSYSETDTIEQSYVANSLGFTPIYTILYYMLNCHIDNDQTKYLVFCHEMPFTVVTHANIATGKVKLPRSVNGNNKSGSSLVGSKLNQIVWYENEENGYTKGTYWFSRLLEYKGIKLCIGGHKHTYCVTYPLRENYQYGILNSIDNGPMPMEPTLENDNVQFTWNETIKSTGKIYLNAISELASVPKDATHVKNENVHTFTYMDKETEKTVTVNSEYDIEYDSASAKWKSFTNNEISIISDSSMDHTKFPLTYREDIGITNDQSILYPYKPINDSYSGVIYFMSQASGYKLTSNKELPTAQQKFTRVLPKTNNATEKPSNDQKYPMIVIYELDHELGNESNDEQKSNIKIKLARVHNIFDDTSHTFTQLTYGKDTLTLEFMKRDKASNDYGKWYKISELDSQNEDFYIFKDPINW